MASSKFGEAVSLHASMAGCLDGVMGSAALTGGVSVRTVQQELETGTPPQVICCPFRERSTFCSMSGSSSHVSLRLMEIMGPALAPAVYLQVQFHSHLGEACTLVWCQWTCSSCLSDATIKCELPLP